VADDILARLLQRE